MILIEDFIDRLTDLTKKNQSGFDTGKSITGKINLSQNEFAQYLYSIYEINQNAVDLAAPITKPFSASSNANGILAYPEGYSHMLSLRYVNSAGKPVKCQRIGINQLGIIEKIPQRRADITKDRVLYSYIDQGVQNYPEQALDFKGVFFKNPPEAKIGYTYVTEGGQHKRVIDPDQTENLIWGQNCFNLLIYMVMDKMGISVREQILNEYAQLGIEKEKVKEQN